MSDCLIGSTSAIDSQAEALMPYFGTNFDVSNLRWYCREIREGFANTPTEVTIVIPCASVDEAYFSVALNPDGPLASIMHGTPVAVKKRWYDPDEENWTDLLVFVGRVCGIKHHPENDSIEIRAKDARDRIKDTRIVGRWIVGLAFQQGERPHFNPGGMPNCIFTQGVPVFAPFPNFGLTDGDDENPPDPSDQSETQACYWTLANILIYLATFYGPQSNLSTIIQAAVAAAKDLWPEYITVPEDIQWGLNGGDLDNYTESNFDNAVGQNNTGQGGARKGRDLDMTGRAMIGNGPGDEGALDMLYNAAGGWGYAMDFYAAGPGEFSQIIMPKPVRWMNVTQAVDIPYAAGGKAQDIFGGHVAAIAEELQLEESSENTYTRVCGVSGRVKIERRVGTLGDLEFSLKTAWDDAELDALMTDAVVGGAADKTSVTHAFAAHPWPLAIWMLDPLFDFQAGTDQAGMPRANAARQIMAQLLSYQGGSGAGDILPWPIRIEASADNGATWDVVLEQSGLEVWENGIIYVPALRDIVLANSQQLGSWTWGAGGEFGVVAGQIDLSACDLRMTVGIPCDHCLSYAVRSTRESEASTNNPALFGRADEGPDADKLDPSFRRTLYANFGPLYQEWLRVGSYPVPESAGGAQAEDRTAADYSLRSDRALLQAHVTRNYLDNYQLTITCEIPFPGIVTNYGVGTAINNLVPVGVDGKSPYPLRRVVLRRRFGCEPAVDEQGHDIFRCKTFLGV